MIKLGYFTHTDVSPSETFVFDLIKALNSEKEIALTVYGGKKNHEIRGIENLKVISTGFSQKGLNTSFKLYKLGQILGSKGHLLKNRYQQTKAIKALHSAIKNDLLPNIAYIEYGTTAVLCYKFLLEKKIPYLVHVHGYDVTSAINDPVYRGELINALNSASYVITPSNHIKRYVILLGCFSEKIKVIHPISNLNEIKPLEPKNSTKNQTIIFLGRLTPKKNPIALVYAFSIVSKHMPNARLEILGDGELKKELQTLIKTLHLEEKVTLVGVVNKKTAFEHLSKASVYAQHSVTSLQGDQEGFPVSLAEAAAHGLPIVSTIHSGITENVIDGETGFLVQEYNFEAMAEKIIFLLKNPDTAKAMGKAGRLRILKLCEPINRIDKIKGLIYEKTKETGCDSM